MSTEFRWRCFSSSFLILVLLTKITISPAFETEKYYRLNAEWIRVFDTLFPVDINQDSTDELVGQRGLQIDILDGELNYFNSSFKFSSSKKYFVRPLYGSSLDSNAFLVSYEECDSSIYKILSPTSLTYGKTISENYLKDFKR